MAKKEWSYQDRGYPENNALMHLIKFYVFECPVRGVSNRGRDFSNLGWSGPAFATLRKMMLANSTLSSNRWRQLEDKDSIADTLREWGQCERPTFEFEFAVYTKSGKRKIEGIYYMIRNAFAHGSFYRCSVKRINYYVFENRKNGVIRGRAVLRESTLRAWKAVVLNPDQYLSS